MISKVCEKWVAEQLTAHLNLGNTPLHPMQFGFCANHSTETANCYFLENVKSKLDRGGVVGAVFLDLKKAFSPGKVTHFGAKNRTNCKIIFFSIDHFYEVSRTTY